MAFCPKCGNETKVELLQCPKCNATQVDYKYKIVELKEESNAWLWLIPSFFVPLFGLIAFVILGYNRPKASKFTMIGAVAGCVTMFLIFAIVVVMEFGLT